MTERLLNSAKVFYVVQRNDTLSQIGERLNISWHKIYKLNNLTNPDLIYPGQLLQIEE